MKGINIYGSPEGAITFCEFINEASYELKNYYGSQEFASCLKGEASKVSKAKCSKDDIYDFETGALISLMKMCGFDKSYKAIEEAFRYNSYDAKKNKELEEENSELKKRINELEIYNNQLEDRVAGEQRGGYKLLKDMEKLEEENEKLKNESMHRLRDKLDLKEKYVALIAENEKLKLDCEKLQHGYIDTDMMFCGGRTCGKQYKALVELFKKLSQDKVDAAYKEAYGVKVISVARDALDSLLESCKYGILTDKNGGRIEKWTGISEFTLELKVPTKREEMWANIVGASQDPPVDIKVAKQDIRAFLKELQEHIPKARWNGSDCLPTEYTNPYWFKHDYIYFALFRYVSKGDLRICYDECKHTWISKPVIEYIAPMRWDLFKKGRIAVKVTYKNYKEFYEACENELGKKPSTMFTGDFTVSICKKDGCFEVFTVEHQKKTGRKIVVWEDVR